MKMKMHSLLKCKYPLFPTLVVCIFLVAIIQIINVSTNSSRTTFSTEKHISIDTRTTHVHAWRIVPALTRELAVTLKDFETERKSFSFARHGTPLPLYKYSKVPRLQRSTHIFPPLPKFSESVECNSLIEGDTSAVERFKNMNVTARDAWQFIKATENCQQFKTDFGYITHPLTKEEETFPLAYSILMYKDIEQVERLLRAIYRPQNLYCFHVDSKSSPDVKKAIDVISGCFDNVFVSSRSVDVVWGSFSVLEPELICMEDLWRKSRKWKYFINLTGQEFPLRTNWELVQILRTYNGANNIEGSVNRTKHQRFAGAGPPLESVRPVKGGVHIVAGRNFVDFILHDQRVTEFLEWCKKTEIPDEVFFSSLNHNPGLGIKGTYKGNPESDDDKNPFLTRFKNWGEDWHCLGQYVHDICVPGVGDLPLLASREELFFNKFISGFEPVAQYCLDELLYNRTVDEYYGVLEFNTSYYGSRDFVINQVT